MSRKRPLTIGQQMAAKRNAALSPERRSEIARQAVNVRWSRYRAAKRKTKGKAAA